MISQFRNAIGEPSLPPFPFLFPFNVHHILIGRAAKKPYNQDEVIATYKRLIHSMPRANQYLLLYVLDLLSVFARKSDKNLMTAQSALFPLLSSLLLSSPLLSSSPSLSFIGPPFFWPFWVRR